MDLTFSETDELLAATLRDYAQTRLLPDVKRGRTEPYPRELLRELGHLGVLGIKVPGCWRRPHARRDGTPEIMKAIIARETFGREFAAHK